VTEPGVVKSGKNKSNTNPYVPPHNTKPPKTLKPSINDKKTKKKVPPKMKRGAPGQQY